MHGVHCLKFTRNAPALAFAIRNVIEGGIALAPIARRAVEAVWREFHINAVLPRIEAVLMDAARAGVDQSAAGSPDEAYRLARLAEQLAENLIEEHVMTCP